ANFAIALAMDSRIRVLVIDANLRTPGLHAAFKIDPTPGLSDLLTSNGRGARPVKVGPGNLHVIPCGRPYAELHSLFESHRFEEFLRRMRERHDYVIFDGPPVHGSSECRVLCAKVDGVVLVIESGKTRRQVAISAKKQLVEAGGRVLGVVLNKRRFYIPEFIYRWL
ncbi:CpsD/CapB family tyrosine-protein kinase, partial [Petrachloros mirabilis]